MAQATLDLPNAKSIVDLHRAIRDMAETLDCDVRFRGLRDFVLVPREKRADVIRFPARMRSMPTGPGGAA